MRVAIGGFVHETNTFHPAPTTLAEFREPTGTWAEGDALLETFAETRSVLGGMIAVGRSRGWTLVPTFYTYGGATTGLIAAAAIETIRRTLVESVAAARADGVLLFLHGAAAAEGLPDPEAVVLRDVRAAVGPRSRPRGNSAISRRCGIHRGKRASQAPSRRLSTLWRWLWIIMKSLQSRCFSGTRFPQGKRLRGRREGARVAASRRPATSE